MPAPEVPGVLLIGTDDGLRSLDDDDRSALEGRSIQALAARASTTWAVADGGEILSWTDGGEWRSAASLESEEATCLLPTDDGLLVGSSGAHLLRLTNGALQPVDGFEAAPGREDWYTPWGGPPSTRSLSLGADGELYANVHVGGILKSVDAGATWTPTVDIHADVHEVRAIRSLPGLVLAATARGFAVSRDFGESWEFVTEGLVATYSRAIALAGETVLMTASDGPRGGHAAVYRQALDSGSSARFERCREGLPEWFDRNIDTGCLDASGETVALGTASGALYLSSDSGASWELAADALPPVRCLLLMPQLRSLPRP